MKYRYQYLGIVLVLTVSIISVLLSRGADRAVSWAVEVAYLSAVMVLPLVLIASFFGRRNPASLKTIAAIGLGLVLHQIVANNPWVGIFREFTYSWQNKLLMLSYLAIAMSAMSRQQLAEAGILRLPRRDSWLAILLVTASLIAFAGPSRNPPQLETVLFQLTMPGPDEEILFRGLLIWAFDAALPATKRILGVDVSLGALLSSLLFGLCHGIYLNEAGSIAVIVDPLLYALTVGLVLTWLRLRCGSIWPAVIAHNLSNGTRELIALFS